MKASLLKSVLKWSAVISLSMAAILPQQAMSAPAQAADAIYLGGTIVTVNELQPHAEALAIRGGRIIAAGYRNEVMKLKGASTRLVDLGGKPTTGR